MRVLIASDNRIYKLDRSFYASNSFQKVIARYKKYFGSITICTRVVECDVSDTIPKSFVDITSITNNIRSIDSIGKVFLGVENDKLRKMIDDSDFVVSRVPTITGFKSADISKSKRKPYLVEVVGCAWDAYWNYSLLGKAFALLGFLWMKRVVWNATYATYVTERFLQKRYKCSCKNIHCSNVLIPPLDESTLLNRLEQNKRIKAKRIVMFTAAAIDVPYKGQEFVIKAIPLLMKRGIYIEYRLAGTGNSKRLHDIAIQYKVENRVCFLGSLSHDDVIKEMDNADIYIQPSLQEGLPRAVIEAMSRGCLVLGAKTAGIPELINKECVFKRSSFIDIARCVEEVLRLDYNAFSVKNYNKSKEYECSELERRRELFYKDIINELKLEEISRCE